MTPDTIKGIPRTSNDESQFPSAIFSSLGTGAEGSAGKIETAARSLSLDDGARLVADTSGEGLLV